MHKTLTFFSFNVNELFTLLLTLIQVQLLFQSEFLCHGRSVSLFAKSSFVPLIGGQNEGLICYEYIDRVPYFH